MDHYQRSRGWRKSLRFSSFAWFGSSTYSLFWSVVWCCWRDFFPIPFETSSTFPALFSDMDNNGKKHGIERYEWGNDYSCDLLLLFLLLLQVDSPSFWNIESSIAYQLVIPFLWQPLKKCFWELADKTKKIKRLHWRWNKKWKCGTVW